MLFDLDGTITDSAAGITASLIHTLEQLGRPVPTPSELTEFIGPPIMDGFAALGLDEAMRHRALEIYRAWYHDHGAFDSTVYAGVPDVIRQLVADGIPVAIATSKPQTQATRILEHYGLADLFVFIGGASDDETRSEKVDVVAWVLQHLDELGIDHSNTVMVGDRSHDVIGARENGIPTIAVEWGYGAREEWVGAIAIASTPDQLLGYLTAGV